MPAPIKNVLLLTATVTPHPNMPALSMKDADVRYQQYCDAFEFLVKSGATRFFDQIILCENSNFPLERFDKAFAGSEAEVIYMPIPMDASAGFYGRGYSEMMLIDATMKQCDGIIGDRDLVWKLTGRYKIKNLLKVIGATGNGADLVVNLRRYPKKWADLYLFAFNRASWNLISGRLDELKTASIVGEVIMYGVVEDIAAKGLKVKDRLAAEPHVVGIRGFDQRQYDSGKQKAKRYIRQVLRMFAPGLRV